MTCQFQFESDGKTITVEVKNPSEYGDFRDLIFLDHDIEYDIAFVAMGGNMSTAYLLHLLWYDTNFNAEVFSVCGKNIEFAVRLQEQYEWVRLNDVNARMILSLSITPNGRIPIILRGLDFTIDQRIAMLDGAEQDDIIEFLTQYVGEDLLPERRYELESRLCPERMGALAFQVGYYSYRLHPDQFLRVLLNSTDDVMADAMLEFGHLMSYKENVTLLDVMTDENHIARVLPYTHHLTAYDVMRYAQKIKSRALRWMLGNKIIYLSPEQRRRLMGEGQ